MKISKAEFAAYILSNPYIKTEPTVPQARFLADSSLESLYGGAAGGGKSEAMLIAALMYVEDPDYAALLLRKTYKDLALPGAIMDRAHSWLVNTNARWQEDEKTWNFPSGATLTFGYLESENDKYRYQGADFRFIGFDELTQFTESQYQYLFSRLRKSVDCAIPLRMRAASNPGGVGHGWVYQRYIKTPDISTKFFPAMYTDNPFLDHTEYKKSLEKLDHITRAQLMDGNWDISPNNGLFKSEFFRYFDFVDNIIHIQNGIVYNLHECVIFQTCDPAVSTKSSADNFVLDTWAKTRDGKLFLLDKLILKLEGPDQINLFVQQYVKWKPAFQAIESIGVGKTIYQMLQRENLPIRELKADKDKWTRALPAAALLESGKIYFRRDLTNLYEFETELVSFPQGAHDDNVDSLSYAAQLSLDLTSPTSNYYSRIRAHRR